MAQGLADYKKSVEDLPLYASDRKKLLALPFYMAKRSECPEPRRGQFEWDLFKELTGSDWNDDAGYKFDEEHKITEFDYEKYLNPELLKNVDTTTDSFKDFIKALNYSTKTKHERLQEQKAQFRELLPVLATLRDDKEKRAFIHLIRNNQGNGRVSNEYTKRAMDDVVDDSLLVELSKRSEKELFDVKNHYRHQKLTMQYADKSRMPIDERNVRDVLRNQHIVRQKINQELRTYTEIQETSQFEHGLLSYTREGAWGELKDLLTEVGIRRDSIPFYNLERMREGKDKLVHGSDDQFKYLMNALFVPLDMTDHETTFTSFNEVGEELSFHNKNWIYTYLKEAHPQIDALASIETIENMPHYGTGATQSAIIADKYAEVEEEEEEFYGSEAGGDDDYGDEDEEGGDEEADYGEEEESDEEEWPPKNLIEPSEQGNRFFREDETLR